ncbi:MAG: phosphoribosyl-AMP cyclohydrolase [Pseudomonadota bacterium]|nr:phosphoribosyl-AMP cyclohydrolase [Rhodospirillaceae bacterium]MEC7972608.1 phosphoribosyl-AMP cyclohydrolase [Pseudomonadota bacterium]MEC9100746.1 phosphoribosyl-AMP cyclohydrolase [Pseudomonadota bacterium]
MGSSTTPNDFIPQGTIEEVEQGSLLMPKFDKDGLIPCITTDVKSGVILMFAFMNRDALAKTIQTREAHYWSRSRSELWKKGSSSGHTQKVIDIRVDCDQDAICLIVDQTGAACHVGYYSCFHRSIELDTVSDVKKVRLVKNEKHKKYDPDLVYGKKNR